ncbi:hypothetical protein V6N11_073784 [Hibiscus sabdariffa]|uniref:Uncharacterized protein n=1 Tax=Hibiscus sabdariffa TaxID=183260 RepID=A0ABR2P4L0_9ROSI
MNASKEREKVLANVLSRAKGKSLLSVILKPLEYLSLLNLERTDSRLFQSKQQLEHQLKYYSFFLSAVDAHTGSHLFKEVLLRSLSSKTVIYVTHQVEFLPPADLILVMEGGRITQAGKTKYW